ncbi:hypothetical protein QTP86_002742 [Hemibagrus guttatus]|nr:hypothetical protein QTP86_002742 [Hemibagrus guttatus]
MPYGLTNAPTVFQEFINKVFKDVLNKYVITFIDDILIYEDHVHHVLTVLTCLLRHQLYVKAEKCEFRHVPGVCYFPERSRDGPKRLFWMDQTRSAFKQLKKSFTTAPILHHADPNLPFVVEVDASSCGIGPVLSHSHMDPGKFHPSAYFSR